MKDHDHIEWDLQGYFERTGSLQWPVPKSKRFNINYVYRGLIITALWKYRLCQCSHCRMYHPFNLTCLN